MILNNLLYMKLLKKILNIVFICAVFVSCNKEPEDLTDQTDQTVFMYMPWSTNLTSHFKINIEDFSKAIERKASEKIRVVVFFATSSSEAILFEMRYYNGKVLKRDLKSYDISTFTTAKGITSLINEVKTFAPSNKYSMIVSCHGLGWLPVVPLEARGVGQKDYWEYEGVYLTRYFGGLSPEYQIDISTFADGIKATGTKMEYILFDDCYMSNIEVAYDLKEVADYIIASPTEIMAFGFPYNDVGGYLLGDVDYKGVIEGFYSFYSNYEAPYGTIGVIACQEVGNMANLMQEINSRYIFTSNDNTVQRMDGYSPIIFFDFGDYVSKLCDDKYLLSKFDSQLEKLVPYRANTESYYSMSTGAINIKHYSGITISDLSRNSKAKTKKETAWYKFTHKI